MNNNQNQVQQTEFYYDQSRLPKGRYEAIITKASAELREDHGYHKIRLDLELLSDGRRGQQEQKEYHLNSKKAVAYMRGEFERLGVSVGGPDQLDSACRAIEGSNVSIAVDYADNGNRAIYINGMGSGQPSRKDSFEDIWD